RGRRGSRVLAEPCRSRGLCVRMAVQIRSHDQMTDAPGALPTTGKPLAGLRVVEVATFVAGPLGGMTLAQLGADVIRVDPLGGAVDYTRWPLAASGTSLYWTGLNKAKRSFCADFRSAEGRELISRLIAGSGPGGGIVLTNADRPWLSYQALARVRSDLIHLRIEGHRDGGS